MEIIPVSTNNPLFSQTTALSGRDFILTFAWNIRESTWYLDIADQDGVLLAASRKVVVDYPVLLRRTDPRLPQGMIMAIDTSGAGKEATLDDFGTRVIVMYMEASDFA